tara:strand:+ start:96 stop:1010 length:915 start_codon:yes stop_codon:yes gene_type:complete
MQRSSTTENWPDALELGPVTVLTGQDQGKYPHGNSILVTGTNEKILVDPSLTIAERGISFDVDRILLSHVHEDHIPGMSRLPGVPVLCHEEDAVGLTSLDGLMSMYGLPGEIEEEFRKEVLEDFSYAPRKQVSTFTDGTTLDLGEVNIEVIHTPGHTRGHCAFLIPEARVVYLGDIELSGFGPYYFDAWSSLESFEKSLQLCGEIDADHFVTFHHKWVVSGKDRFLGMLRDFGTVITERELAMLAFMSEPKSVEDCALQRFVYRPSVDTKFVHHVETRSAQIHIDRMLRDGRLTQVTESSFRAA